MFEGLIDGLMSNMKNDKNEALCMMKDHPDLGESFKFFDREMAAFDKRKKELCEERDIQHKKFWHSFEQKLVDKGFLTEKDIKEKCGLNVRDGVVFKQIRNVEDK